MKGKIQLGLVICAGACLTHGTVYGDAGSGSAVTWQDHQAYEVPEWFRDAKFGIYAHWGPASIGTYGAFDDWYASSLYSPECRGGRAYRYHQEAFGDPSEVGYKDIIKKFDPSGFDAEALGALYAQSGAKFAGPVAIHHDNFAMWDSKLSRWNSVNYGGIDVSGELEKSIRKHGMKYMMSSHLAFSWFFYRPAYEYDGADPAYEDLYHTPHEGPISVKPRTKGEKPDAKFNAMWLSKMKEMIDLYSPDLMWFDFGPESLTPETRKEYFDYYFGAAQKRGSEVVVTYKHKAKKSVPANVAVLDHERGAEAEIAESPWLTDTSIGPWYYERGFEDEQLDNSELIKMLVDIVSKNGCLLFNVPLKRDGSVPKNTKEILLETGEWLEVNGEAVYGTRPWTRFGEGPGMDASVKTISKLQAADIRFTTKGKTLYAVSMGAPEGSMTIASCGSAAGEVSRVTMLGHEGDLQFAQDASGLHIQLPASLPSTYANTLQIEGMIQ